MNTEIIESLLDGSLTLDCPNITLSPTSSSSNKKELTGAGTIVINESGSFELKVFFAEEFSIEETFVGLNWESGKVIAEEHYYNLKAFDLMGNEWIATRVLPDRSSGPYGSMIKADLNEIQCTDSSDVAKMGAQLQFFFNKAIRIPLNTVATDVTSIGGKVRQQRIGYKLAQFASNEMSFEIDTSGGKTILRANTDHEEFDQIQISRILESFNFVLANTTSWSALVIRDKKLKTTRLRAVKPEATKSRVGMPIRRDSNQVWSLFDTYFRYVSQNSKDPTHLISEIARSILEAGKSSLEVEALTLSVSIESFLMSEFKHLYELPNSHMSGIQCISNSISELGNIDNQIRKRALGMMGSMKNPRAKDILGVLNANGLIAPELINVYSKIRNKMAHGAIDPNLDVQTFINQISSVLVLFYQLVYLRIGYLGEYVDYGQYGYPTKKFEAKLS